MSGALNGAHARRALYGAQSPKGWIIKTTLFSHPGYTRAHELHLFPVSRATLTHGFLMFIHSFPPPFSPFSRVLPAFRLLFARDYSHAGGPVRRARLFIYWRAGAVTIWAPRFRRCCATRAASGATASTAATTTRNSTSSTCFTTGFRAACTYLARISSTSNPAWSTLCAQGRCQVRSDLTSRPRPDLRSYLFTHDLT